MVRRHRLVVGLALVGVLVTLVFPGASSAFAGYDIVLTASGPSPVDAKIQGAQLPLWENQDTVTHTIAFADGCSFDVAPSSVVAGKCRHSWSGLGTHPYTVDATVQASVTEVLSDRHVTLRSKRHGFWLGTKIRLHGSLVASIVGAPPDFNGLRMPVTVYARRDRFHLWHRIAVVMSQPLKKPNIHSPHSVWKVWVRPFRSTTYVAVADSAPKAWRRARSGLFGVYVRHRGRHHPVSR